VFDTAPDLLRHDYRSVVGWVVGGVGQTRAVDATLLVELALRFPEVTRADGPSWTSIRFRTSGFGWVKHDANLLMLKSTHGERAALIGHDPETYAEGWESTTTAWVTVALDRITPDEALELLADAWRLTATKKAITAFEAAHPDGLP